MKRAFASPDGRRWFAPEVVQTSSMDCGPAALKCLLEGYHVPVSYGRLREACQTSVDGTSIDTIEVVAGELGLAAEQSLLPIDHITLDAAGVLPAIVVVRHADTATHFVVVWRRHGRWLQVMDPALGRRWVSVERFRDEIFSHALSVEAPRWRVWAGSEDCLAPLRARLAALGVPSAASADLIAEALTDSGWFSMGALDAAVRLVASLSEAGGVRSGDEAARLAAALFRDTRDSDSAIFAVIPEAFWSVSPDTTNTDPTREMLRVRGGVLLRVAGAHGPAARGPDAAPLSPELAAALTERPAAPLAAVWRMLGEDGLTAPIALAGAVGLATAAVMLELLLFRGLFELASVLSLPSQRIAAMGALLVFVGLVVAIDLIVGLETLRLGRRLETRLRMALLAKLPRLNDSYFHSRPITDMAERGHSVQVSRAVPALGLQFVQTLFDLALTVAGVIWLAPDQAGIVLTLAAVAVGAPMIIQPLLNEHDLRTRNQAAALHGFYLDAMLGLAPIRAHRAERSVRRQHEGLLVEWGRSFRGLARLALCSNAAQGLVCTGLAGLVIILHLAAEGRVGGGDLLLAVWSLKLPGVGARFAGLAQQYPAQRNVLLRLLEPLQALEGADEAAGGAPVDAAEASAIAPRAVSIAIQGGRVVAAGHEILRDLNIQVAQGEHVAIVGRSGAGKSALLGVLLGWNRLEAGTLSLDGAPAGSSAVEALRRATAWVDPAIQIWNRTLLDNLTYASDDESFQRVGAVIDAARLRGVARTLPQGLQTPLGEGGGLLSGGEGQRVRLGRALMMEAPRLVLLDEPLRGLARDQRHELLEVSRRHWSGVTLLCVTHDVSETRLFDRVLVVEDGEIVEDGAPTALERPGSRFQALLDAEQRLHDTLWAGAQWRRLSLHDGRLLEAAVAA